MQNLSLRTRIFISYFVLIALSASGVWWVASKQLQDVVEGAFFEAFEEHNEVAIGQIEDYLVEAIEEPEGFDEQAWHQEMVNIASELDFTLELLDLDGETRIYHSEEGFDETTIDLYREVEWLLEDDEAYIEIERYEELEVIAQVQRIYYEEDPQFIARLSESNANSADQLRSQTVTLTIGTAVSGLLLLVLLAGWLARALTQPLTQLRHTVQAMAAGQLDARAETDAPAEVQRLAQDFNQMAAAVEEMVAHQRTFANNAAHELRTPLTGIRLRLETLLEDDPDEALMQRYLTEIDGEAARLSRLVQDLRILSHTDGQQLTIGTSSVRVDQLLNALAYEFAPQVTEKQLRYEMHLSAEISPITASTNHIRTILRNLIENAIKYTPEHGAIAISAQQEDGQLIVRIVDDGIGVSAENIPHLFNRFYRVDPARNRKIAGSGLGLSLAQSIATLYGGKITITSAGLNQGTCAQLKLPYA
ncbi:MAG: sensor histidine kinase [Candidatus Promineifilaceae bacterium]